MLAHGRQVMSLLCLSDIIKLCFSDVIRHLNKFSTFWELIFEIKMRDSMVSRKIINLFADGIEISVITKGL